MTSLVRIVCYWMFIRPEGMSPLMCFQGDFLLKKTPVVDGECRKSIFRISNGMRTVPD